MYPYEDPRTKIEMAVLHDRIERLVQLVRRTAATEICLLSDGIHSIDGNPFPKPHVAVDHMERVRDALKRMVVEADRIRQR
jgi:hypothetical protein